MRSRKVQLEQDVIVAARQHVQALGWASGEADLARSVEALDAHLAEITDAKGAFNPGSDTSAGAAAMSVPMVGTVRRRIIDEIRSTGSINDIQGLTDDQLEYRLVRSHTTISSARNWLVAAGWLEDSGHRRDTKAGRPATVWCLTMAARRRITSPEWVQGARG